MSRFDIIEEQASRWLAREDRGLSAREAEELEAWLSADTAHRIAYLRLEADWRKADCLSGVAHNAAAAAKPRSYGPVWPAIAAGLLVAIVGASLYWQGGLPTVNADQTYQSPLGQTKIVKLTDGTKVQLNTQTQLRQHMSAGARVVTLDRGEAFFDVAKDKSRPFVVYAGDRKITDIGTKFSVRRDGEGIEIVVAQGRVRIDMSDPRAGSRFVEAQAGNVIVAKSDGTLVTSQSRETIADRLSWRQGVLVFNKVTLGAAAAQFNRYNAKHIVVVGAARDLPIGGRFKADNVEVFTSLIKEGFGLKIEDTGTEIIVSD